MTETLARIDGVTKRFVEEGTPAIEALTTRIEAGRVTGLVGPDGAGKTTLLRLMAGLLLPDDGTLHICGFAPAADVIALHRVVAYMPQRFGLYEELSVIENLELSADLRSVVGTEREEALARLLTFTGLAPFTRRLAGALSGGMKQKLGLACALIKRPRLLLLDEPSVGVDPLSRRELWRLVYALVDQGIGVVWSTAYLDEAERCASVLLLSGGKALYQGPPQALTRRLEGRTFLVRNMSGERRAVLTRALERPDVIDGVIQGRSVRLVVGQDGVAPTPASLDAGSEAVMTTVPPRFEDAFMDLLGGGPRGRSPFAEGGPSREQPVDSVVEAEGLTRRFGAFTAVDGIRLRVGRGEIFGLIGPNGAGKSTTFKMLCGLLHPTSGTARVVGLDLAKAPSQARARLGYMAQQFSLYGDLSVGQNLNFFAGIYGLGGRRRRNALERMVDIFALGPYLGVNAGTLPLGFKQRLALACAVMHAPDVLFLDEPTSGVDPRTRREFWSHINAMVANGMTIMVTTHFLDEAEYCDRMALVYRGRLIATGAPDDLKERVRCAGRPEPTLEDAFIALVEADDRRSAA
ncbi:ATP-binding cassette domain-containing protein [Halomonas beimenensis]|uniref:ABC transporter multidrug efflux pump, fused ATP-binding domains n=1 Tax=Halomonas beimenensis TaxID=475662 RepID=A0A291P926_9GAMM|nr:ATP-binding cassette domain-containing protein [Halomonas beimenensis]ATJ83352.1 ABC transporter multidrug efflux pump, fused ATP-binding domains [Halomonas beimenensis]